MFKWPQSLCNILLIGFVANHDPKILIKKIFVNRFAHYYEHCNPKFYYIEILLLHVSLFDNEDTLKCIHSTWHSAYVLQNKFV
jgi:hypothetical protein